MPINEVFHLRLSAVPNVFTRYLRLGPLESSETNRRLALVVCFMKKLLRLGLPFVGLSIGISGCDDIHIGFGGPKIEGDGKAQKESRTVAEFDKVVVGSAFEVVATEGNPAPVKISADSNILPLIKTEVKDRVLKVWIEGSISSHTPLKLSLSTPKISGFEASGATKVDLKLTSKHDLELGGSGSSELKVTGEVTNLNCDLSGASKASLTASSLDKLNTNLSGASALNFSGSVDSLEAELSGASMIKGGMHGNKASVRMSGASNGSFGKFSSVSKELTGASNAHFEGSN